MSIRFKGYNQLRLEYLRCAGHSHLHAPHFDRVANMEIRFTNTDVQTPICDASRMSFYTGRYTQSHGVQWKGFSPRVGKIIMEGPFAQGW